MTFEEEFPSFKRAIPQDVCKDCGRSLYCEKIIEDNCLDKQRVRYVIDNVLHQTMGAYDCVRDDIADQLKEELGLERGDD